MTAPFPAAIPMETMESAFHQALDRAGRRHDSVQCPTGPNEQAARAMRQHADDFNRQMGTEVVPVDWRPEVKTSPVFNYPYVRTREALESLARNGAPDPYHGHKLRYVNPASGEFAMPTIATFVQLMPAGFASQPYRSTDGTVFVVVEGKGETRIGDKTFAWEPHDIFVVPSWMTHTHHPGSEAVLFSFSDRVVQEKLGLWREARGNA